MKKLAAKRRKPPRRKRAGPRDLFAGVDLQLVRKLLARELALEEKSLEDMVDGFLSACPDAIEDMPDEEAMSDLVEELDRARVDANGGDPAAREALKAVREKIDKAARRDEIHPAILILIGRLFAGAKVDVGEVARASMGRMVSAGFFQLPEEAYPMFVGPMLTSNEGDAFAAHEEIQSAIAIFPPHFKAGIVEPLAADADARSCRCAVGFLLDPEEAVALAAVRGLAAAAGGGLDADCRRWVGMIRDWLPPSRRQALDAALPPSPRGIRRPAGEVEKATVSACDGSGAAALVATLKRGAQYCVATVMTKPSGVAESMLLEDLSKSEAAALGDATSASVPTSEVSLASWLRLIRLALGRNLARGAPPPFALVGALDAIGLDSLAPELSTPREIIDMALAGVPNCDDAAAIDHAHQSIVDSDIADRWFEAGEEVDAVLKATDSIEEGAQALIEGYLPGRRVFWASQCALSAVALKEAEAARGRTWKNLALVGRDLLRDVPMIDIPLMRQIADRSATVYFMQR